MEDPSIKNPEHKRASSAMRKSEEYFKAIIQNSSDIVLILDKLGTITYASPSIERFLGYGPDELIGKRSLDLIVSDDKPRAIADFGRALLIKEIIIPNVFRIRHKNGTERILEGFGKNLLDNPVVAGFVMNVRDITEREQMEEALRESEKKYRVIAENMTDVISIVDMNMRFTFVSPSIMRLRGFTVEEAMEQPLEEVMTPESLLLAYRSYEEELQLESSGTADPDRVRTIELEEYRKDMSMIWVEVSLSFLRDMDGRPIGILSLTRDIDARKRAEDELKKSKTLLESVFNSSQDLILVIDRDLRVLMSNWKSELYAGHTEFPINAHCFEAFIQRDTPCEPCHALGVFNTGEPIITEYYNQYTELFKEVTAYPIFDNNKHVIMVAEHVRDITERKRAGDELRRTLESLRKAIGTTIHVLASAVETRDPYTAGHQLRSADLARAIATEMGLPQDRIDGIRMAGSIHDIGKLYIPAEILSKPRKLTEIEFSLIKEHSEKGYEMLKDVESPWSLAEMVYQHHERMNGSGYPRNLKGDDILMDARILAVADVVESMASHRPYRPALGIEAALDEIEQNRGTLYDNTVADACLRLFREKGFQLERTRF